jgi:hypothetical protein
MDVVFGDDNMRARTDNAAHNFRHPDLGLSLFPVAGA